jgi:hypothetical protein
MISPEEFLDLTSATANHRAGIKRTLMGYIDYNFDINTYPTEWPKVIIDGQGLSQRTYPCLSTYFPRPGDRVVMVPVGTGHVIVGAVLDNPTPPLQPGTLVFKASTDLGQSFPSGGSQNVAILWNIIDLDLLGGWAGNIGSGEDFRGRWAPTVPGWYRLSGTASWVTDTSGWRSTMWRVNGAVVHGGFQRVDAASGGTSQIPARTISVYLNGSGDYLELCAGQNTGDNLSLTSASIDVLPHMEAVYVGPGELNVPLPSVE